MRVVAGLRDVSVGSGGLVMHGGFFADLLAGLIYFRIRRYPFLPYADAIAPGIGLGVCLTRIGRFMNGCCYGVPCGGFPSASFPPSSPPGRYEQGFALSGLFPSQLLESACGLIILALVLLAGRRKTFDGFLLSLVCVLYAASRFAIDFTRDYGPEERVGMLSHTQVVCIALFAVCGALIVRNLRLPNHPHRLQHAPSG